MESRIRQLVWLGSVNLIVMIGLAGILLLALLPKLERAVATSERVEARFQDLADELQPVLNASTEKSIEAIQKMDADQLAETATQSSDEAIRELGESAKRFLNRDKRENGQDD